MPKLTGDHLVAGHGALICNLVELNSNLVFLQEPIGHKPSP